MLVIQSHLLKVLLQQSVVGVQLVVEPGLFYIFLQIVV